jgi:dihydroorotate dehydrogenase (fumarate)
MNLSTTYLGLRLRTPLVPSASPLSEDLNNIKRMEDAGASAIVLHSLFEEQLRHKSDTPHHRSKKGTGRSLTYFPKPEEFRVDPDLYLANIVKAKQEIGLPIIASLNGSSFGGWVRFHGRSRRRAPMRSSSISTRSRPIRSSLPRTLRRPT